MSEFILGQVLSQFDLSYQTFPKVSVFIPQMGNKIAWHPI